MCGRDGCNETIAENDGCRCAFHGKDMYLSRKKRIEALKSYLAGLEDKAEDIREYINELSQG